MCLLFFSHKMTPGCSLVIAANRDEFYDRPTAPLDFFGPEKVLLGGRDLLAGGTWLGISKSGRIGALTNYRRGGSNQPDAVSRGHIVSDFLLADVSPLEFARELETHRNVYNGFNLVCGDGRQLVYYSNQGPAPQVLEPGFYGLSNSLLDIAWPKVARGKAHLQESMQRAYTKDDALNRPTAIVEIMRDQWRPEDKDLPDTGIGLTWERILGSMYIKTAGYGTRSTSVIFMTDLDAIFHEVTYSSAGDDGQPPDLTWRTVAMALTG